MGRYFAVLDSGYDEITAVAARWIKSGDYLVEGFCSTGSRGLRKGIVTDVAAATDSISEVLNKLKERTGRRFSDVYAGITSQSINVASSGGMLLLSKYGRQISDKDVRKCVQIGSIIKMPLDREALHKIVNGFSIDGESFIKNPLNLEGVRLSVEMDIITVSSSALKNLTKCITLAGFIPAGFVFSGLATSYRVLTAEDKEQGAALVDIGTDTTEALVFHGSILKSCKVFPVGTDNGLFSKEKNLNKGRMDSLISGVVSLPEWDRVLKIVVTGRGAMVDSIIEPLEGSLKKPVEIGTFLVKPFEDFPPERTRYLGNVGILDYLREEKLKERPSGNLAKRSFSKVLAFVDRYF
jgi:hypothetical protein